MSTSPKKAWKRVLDKFSPSTNIKHSPVIMTQGKLCPAEYFRDEIMLHVVFFINANEEYHYQTLLELLSGGRSGKTDVNISLRKNRIDVNWPDVLTNFRKLGEGSFGVVYQVTDKITNEIYAVKEAKSRHSDFLSNLISVIMERNAHFRANESPFIVKLFGAFQKGTSYWMVFEHCLGDLSNYIDTITCNIALFMDMFLSRNCIETFNSVFLTDLKIDIETIAFVYAFELLAGLDYLASRNLIHRDIKPDNILVSASCHLKIADLGLYQRLSWSDRNSSTKMLEETQFKYHEKLDIRGNYGGNRLYSDPETTIYYDLIVHENTLYTMMQSRYFPIQNGKQNFMSDLYGISLVILELLFFGMNFLKTFKFSAKVKETYDLSNSNKISLFSLKCIFDDYIYDTYTKTLLTNQITEKNHDLILFLLSVFRPRQERAIGYTKPITLYLFKNRATSSCIDITRIENLSLYRDMGITRYNVSSIKLPDIIKLMYTKKTIPVTAKTMSDIISKLDDKEKDMRFYPIPSFNYTR